jgi:hypothetical protein
MKNGKLVMIECDKLSIIEEIVSWKQQFVNDVHIQVFLNDFS